jgi:hypothetical protein
MIPLVVFYLLAQAPQPDSAGTMIHEISQSGRLVTLAEPSSQRLATPQGIAPGAPPILAFRYLEGKDRHRFGKLDLIVDDAGH